MCAFCMLIFGMRVNDTEGDGSVFRLLEDTSSSTVYHICKCTHYSNACGPICSYFLAIIRSLHDEANLLGG